MTTAACAIEDSSGLENVEGDTPGAYFKPKYVNLIIPHQASTAFPTTLTIKQHTQLQTLLSGSTKP